jgi:hypothetical protein
MQTRTPALVLLPKQIQLPAPQLLWWPPPTRTRTQMVLTPQTRQRMLRQRAPAVPAPVIPSPKQIRLSAPPRMWFPSPSRTQLALRSPKQAQMRLPQLPRPPMPLSLPAARLPMFE